MYDKRQPYEADIKVPLLIRGPTFPRNYTDSQPVLNIDIAPTIMALAGLSPPRTMDGRQITVAQEVERYMLVEYYGEGRDDSVDPSCPWKYDSEHLAVGLYIELYCYFTF